MSPFHLLSTLAFAAIISQALADINFKHCLSIVDLGPFSAQGLYPGVCVINHHFQNRAHAWSFRKSIIRNTNFTQCTFEDTPSARQNYYGATWENVLFKYCTFRNSPEIKFDETLLQKVVFDSCTFEATADIHFSKFRFSNVEFRNCTFLSRMSNSLGTIRRLVISNSTFGSTNAARQAIGDGNLSFSQMTISRFILQGSISNSEFRMQQSSVEDIQVLNSTLSSFHCHEKVIGGNKVVKPTQLNDTIMIRASFSDGLYWDNCEIRGLEMQKAKVWNTLDLSSSTIERLALVNVSSLFNSTNSRLDLSSANVRGDLLRGIETETVSYVNANFSSGIEFDNFSIANTNVDLTGTVFSTERVNSECCVQSCPAKKCLCDVPVIPIGNCSAGNSAVNVNMEDSCFPGDAVVSVVKLSGGARETEMRELRHGDLVLHSSELDATAVYFFGHKDGSQRALFRVLTIRCITQCRSSELAISRNHLLPVQNRGLVPAGSVSVGDLLFGADGRSRVVTKVRQEVRSGIYAPATVDGLLSVNGVIVSCYTSVIPARVAHAALTPLRGMFAVGGAVSSLVGKFDLLHKRSPAPLVRSLITLVS